MMFTVPTVNDNIEEDDSFVQVYVNDGTGYTVGSGGAVTILDNDDPIPEVWFSAAAASVSEGDGTRDVQVNLSYQVLSSGFTLRYSASGSAKRGNSADYSVPTTVSVDTGAGSVIIRLPSMMTVVPRATRRLSSLALAVLVTRWAAPESK